MSLFKKVMGIISDGIPKQFRTFKAQTNVGAGFYALQKNVSRGGIAYTKLVQRDKSRILPKNYIENIK